MFSTSSLIVRASSDSMAVMSSSFLDFFWSKSSALRPFDMMILIALAAALYTRSVWATRYSPNTLIAIVMYLNISDFQKASGFFIEAKLRVT